MTLADGSRRLARVVEALNEGDSRRGSTQLIGGWPPRPAVPGRRSPVPSRLRGARSRPWCRRGRGARTSGSCPPRGATSTGRPPCASTASLGFGSSACSVPSPAARNATDQDSSMVPMRSLLLPSAVVFRVPHLARWIALPGLLRSNVRQVTGDKAGTIRAPCRAPRALRAPCSGVGPGEWAYRSGGSVPIRPLTRRARRARPGRSRHRWLGRARRQAGGGLPPTARVSCAGPSRSMRETAPTCQMFTDCHMGQRDLDELPPACAADTACGLAVSGRRGPALSRHSYGLPQRPAIPDSSVTRPAPDRDGARTPRPGRWRP